MTTTTEQRLRTGSDGSRHSNLSTHATNEVSALLLFALLFAFPIAGLCRWAAPLDEVHAAPRAMEYLLDLAETASESGPVPQEPVYGATMGAFHLLTYNTAGLPPIINGLNAFRHFKIGHRLNAYDLALVQEDFFYHERLTFFIKHPFQSQLTFYHYWLLLVLQGRLAPDGLHRFSSMPFLPIERIPWMQCHGTFDFGYDCLALKGFSVSTHWATPDVSFDVYNLHMDAPVATQETRKREWSAWNRCGSVWKSERKKAVP